MLFLIVYLLFCCSILAVGLESQVTSSAEAVQDIFTSISEFALEITIEVQAGRVNFSSIISLISILSVSVEQTALASSHLLSLFILVSNQTLGSNSSAISVYSPPQLTAASSSLIFDQSVMPQVPTVSLVIYTGFVSRDSCLYYSQAVLLFVLGVIQI
jgi:hypothetical protein